MHPLHSLSHIIIRAVLTCSMAGGSEPGYGRTQSPYAAPLSQLAPEDDGSKQRDLCRYEMAAPKRAQAQTAVEKLRLCPWNLSKHHAVFLFFFGTFAPSFLVRLSFTPSPLIVLLGADQTLSPLTRQIFPVTLRCRKVYGSAFPMPGSAVGRCLLTAEPPVLSHDGLNCSLLLTEGHPIVVDELHQHPPIRRHPHQMQLGKLGMRGCKAAWEMAPCLPTPEAHDHSQAGANETSLRVVRSHTEDAP